MVGGYAVGFHGVDREPADLDLLVDPSPDQGRRLTAAIEELGGDVSRYPTGEFGQPGKQIPVKYRGYNSEILTGIEGLSFDEVYAAAHIVRELGMELRVMSRPHLIVSKTGTGRDDDTEDVRRLEEVDD